MKALLRTFIQKVDHFWRPLPFWEKVGAIILLQFAFFAPFISSAGSDFYTTFREATLTGEYGVDTWNPYPAYWLLTPFAILPPQVGFWLWNLVGALGFMVAIRYLNGRFLPFALSLPCFWLFFVGQFEGIVALGLTLGLLAPPLWAGLGLFFLSLKPQLGIIPILFVLLHRRDFRLLLVPAAVYGLSLLHWGWWLPEWIGSMMHNNAGNYSTNISLWPYSLVLLPLFWFRRDSLKVWLIVQSLVMPYFAVYSLALLFTLYLPLWANLLTWGLYIAAIFVPVKMPGYLIPLGLLVHLMVQNRQSAKQPQPDWQR